MINKLVTDIKKYAWYLEENNIYVSIHTEFTEYMMPLLDLNIHKNPKCLLVKSDNDSWERCIRLHSGENHEETQMRLRTCFAGVEEAIFGLECGGTVCISTAEKIDEERLGALVNPLCRMVEYLKMICPKDDFEITDNELVNRAIKFIQRNFYNHISNEEIAGVCSCSVSTLCHLFKKFKGNYSGGFVKAYDDGVIFELTDLLNNYAPNLKNLFETYPQLLMESENDRGQLFAIPMIRGGNILRTYRGPIVRADYLEKFGLEKPETIDDWYNMLTTFKNNGVEIPFTSLNYFFNMTETFVGAYGVTFDFFLEDGQVKYGPIDDRFKDFVVEMAKWYKEGLIDSEITTNDQKILDSKVMNLGAGSFIGTTGNSLGGYISEMSSKNPEFDLVAVPYPVLNKGDEPYLIQRDPTVQLELGSSITTTCEHPEYAMAFLDFAFSKEGNMLFNFGVEGESYVMQDGYPVFTDTVKHNPDGLSFAKAGSLYARSFTSGTFVQDPKYGEQFYGQPRQRESIETWTKSLDKVVEKNTRVRGDLTPEESEEITSMLNEINTYAGEMFIKWVMGRSDVEADFADYQNQLKKLGIDKCIEYRQNAYDRYVEKFPEMKNPQEIEVSDYFWK